MPSSVKETKAAKVPTKKTTKKVAQSQNEINTLELFANLYKPSKLPSKDKSQYWMQAASPTLKSFYSTDKSGKWCIVLQPEEVDEKWEQIKKVIAEDKLMLAKVATALGAANYNTHLVCVYTNDWNDKEELEKTREVLREIGFTEPLKYKRDLETMNGVYGTPNEYYLTM